MSTTSSETKASDSPLPTWRIDALTPIPLSKARDTLATAATESYPTLGATTTSHDSFPCNANIPPFGYINFQQQRDAASRDYYPQQHQQQYQQFPYIAPTSSSDSYAMMHPQNLSSFESSNGSSTQYQHPPPFPPPPPPPPPHMYNHHMPPPHPHMYYHPYPPYGHMYGYPFPLMPPVTIEYITMIQPEDVLSGRGGATNSHSGNREFRRLVKSHQKEYLHAKKRDKPAVAALVVDLIRRKGGRFLKKLDQTNHLGQVFYVEIGDERAKEKACQALREGAPDLRRNRATNKSSAEEKDADSHDEDDTTDEQKEKEEESANGKEPKKANAEEKRSSPEAKSGANEHAADDVESLLGDGPIMIRPCARFMPRRKPVEPFSVDQLPPQMRDMYLRDFLPPSHHPRQKRVCLDGEPTHESTEKPIGHPWPFLTV
ncbi:hypothetical protein MPSEU_000162000 [Mayamaea pseudoterrestris]|nr:hypothetical protein MPSEU_000162000 [Mayamaea pseudoterrestris]